MKSTPSETWISGNRSLRKFEFHETHKSESLNSRIWKLSEAWLSRIPSFRRPGFQEIRVSEHFDFQKSRPPEFGFKKSTHPEVCLHEIQVSGCLDFMISRHPVTRDHEHPGSFQINRFWSPASSVLVSSKDSIQVLKHPSAWTLEYQRFGDLAFMQSKLPAIWTS